MSTIKRLKKYKKIKNNIYFFIFHCIFLAPNMQKQKHLTKKPKSNPNSIRMV